MTGCSTPEPTPTPGADDAALKKTLTAYAVEFLRRNPTTNTYLGGAGLDPSLQDVDGKLRDHSAAALEEEDRWLAGVSKALAETPTASLSGRARIDRDVALAQIRFLLRQHQVRKYQERALDTYVSEPFRALDWQLQGMSETGTGTYGTAAEWTLVVSRVKAIPKFLAVAQEQIEAGVKAGRPPDRRMLQRDGLNTSEANAKYFADTLVTLGSDRIRGAERDRLLPELRAAAKQASDAYLQFRDFIAATFFDAKNSVKQEFAADRYAMGEEE